MKKFLLLIAFVCAPFLINAQCFVQITHTNVTCNGNCDGTATAFPVGTGPFTYLWMPINSTSQNLAGLCAGTYYLTMTDVSSGCVATGMVTITEPPILNLILSSTPASCPTCCDGSIVATAGGGTPAYAYTWSPSGGTGSVASNLCVGTYTCCVVDVNGCATCSNLAVSFMTDVQNQKVAKGLTVFPSPASDVVSVKETFSNSVSIEISVSTILGELVYSKKVGATDELNESIDVSGFTEGVYFISVKTVSGTSVRRFVKQ